MISCAQLLMMPILHLSRHLILLLKPVFHLKKHFLREIGSPLGLMSLVPLTTDIENRLLPFSLF